MLIHTLSETWHFIFIMAARQSIRACVKPWAVTSLFRWVLKSCLNHLLLPLPGYQPLSSSTKIKKVKHQCVETRDCKERSLFKQDSYDCPCFSLSKADRQKEKKVKYMDEIHLQEPWFLLKNLYFSPFSPQDLHITAGLYSQADYLHQRKGQGNNKAKVSSLSPAFHLSAHTALSSCQHMSIPGSIAFPPPVIVYKLEVFLQSPAHQSNDSEVFSSESLGFTQCKGDWGARVQTNVMLALHDAVS